MKDILEVPFKYKTGHTPLPWKQVILHPACILGSGNVSYQSFEIAPDSYFAQHNPKDAKKIAEANAKLIVRAVNSHDYLLSSLKALLRELPAKRDWLDPTIEKHAKAAIKEAEGK